MDGFLFTLCFICLLERILINKKRKYNMQIEKNIPIPEFRKTGITAKMRMLEIGDSFLIEEEKRTHAVPIAKQIRIKVKTAKESDGWVRVWRIE